MPPKARPVATEDAFTLSKKRLSADAPEFVPGSHWAGGAKAQAPGSKPRPVPKLPLRERLTVLITTSPIGRHPATDLIDEVLSSMQLATGLQSCDLILVCDGYKTADADGQPYSEPRYRSGIVDPLSAANYEKYKAVLKLRRRSPSASQPGVQVLELDSRHGFGFGVRAALDYVQTPYVIVMQHDRPFTRNADIPRILSAMEANPSKYKYVGLPTSTTFNHQYHVLSKYGIRLERVKADDRGLQLVPLVQWYDSTHVAETDYYRHFVFGPRRLVVRGGFIEDKFGQAMLADIRARGVAVAHPEYGTFIAAGTCFPEPCVGHLDGRDARCGEKFRHVKQEVREEGGAEKQLQLKNNVPAASAWPPQLSWPGSAAAWRGPGQGGSEAFDPPIRAKSLYVFDGPDGRREWRPCEVLAYYYAEQQYLIRWPCGTLKHVTALQLILEYDQAGAAPPPFAPPQRLPLAPLTAPPLTAPPGPPPWAADPMPLPLPMPLSMGPPPGGARPTGAAAGGVGRAGGGGARPGAARPSPGATPAPAGPVRAPAQLAKESPKAVPAQGQGAAAGAAVCPASGWQYVDPKQQVQGPFTRLEMQHWHSKGYFTSDLRMRCSDTDQFAPFSELFPPPLVPFQSYPKRPKTSRPAD